MDESASAEEKEYATVKLDYELKNKNYERERGRLLSYIQRRREIQLQQIGPFSITREYMTDENEGLPVFEQPVEKYPWKQLFEFLRSIPGGRATDLQASQSGNPGTDCGRFSITGSVTEGWNAPSESMNVQPFVDLLTSGGFQPEADINQDGVVSLLDVDPFVALLVGG